MRTWLIAVLALVLAGCGPTASAASRAPSGPSDSTRPASAPDAEAAGVTLVGAGDIASCTTSGDAATADLLGAIAGTVFTLGDNVYPSGTGAQFRDCYDPTWGQYKSRTRPSPGNHDYMTADASAYFNYFGSRAGNPAKGYYAYDRGAWRIYALNSNCVEIGGCGRGSPQRHWLRTDLAANPHACVLAYWHHPLFSSGPHGDNTFVRPLYRALYDAGAEVILNGHDHLYERFRPQDPTGTRDRDRGIVEFIVGTGGYTHYAFTTIQPNSRVRDNTAFGVLKLTLNAGSYSFEFVPVAGETFTDSGSRSCH